MKGERSEEMRANLLKTLKEKTAYETLEEFCNNYPTLRLDEIACPTYEDYTKMVSLRIYWEEVTGRKAFPQYTDNDIMAYLAGLCKMPVIK